LGKPCFLYILPPYLFDVVQRFKIALCDDKNKNTDGVFSKSLRITLVWSILFAFYADRYVFGSGFPGIRLAHSDTTENISVIVKAQSGNVFLAPMPEKLQQPSDYELSTSREGKDLILQRTIEEINDALQFLQYIGY
jgi:hypothetical protein